MKKTLITFFFVLCFSLSAPSIADTLLHNSSEEAAVIQDSEPLPPPPIHEGGSVSTGMVSGETKSVADQTTPPSPEIPFEQVIEKFFIGLKEGDYRLAAGAFLLILIFIIRRYQGFFLAGIEKVLRRKFAFEKDDKKLLSLFNLILASLGVLSLGLYAGKPFWTSFKEAFFIGSSGAFLWELGQGIFYLWQKYSRKAPEPESTGKEA